MNAALEMCFMDLECRETTWDPWIQRRTMQVVMSFAMHLLSAESPFCCPGVKSEFSNQAEHSVNVNKTRKVIEEWNAKCLNVDGAGTFSVHEKEGEIVVTIQFNFCENDTSWDLDAFKFVKWNEDQFAISSNFWIMRVTPVLGWCQLKFHHVRMCTLVKNISEIVHTYRCFCIWAGVPGYAMDENLICGRIQFTLTVVEYRSNHLLLILSDIIREVRHIDDNSIN